MGEKKETEGKLNILLKCSQDLLLTGMMGFIKSWPSIKLSINFIQLPERRKRNQPES